MNCRQYAWMTSAIEDLQRRLNGIGGEGRETHFLKPLYNVLLPLATAKLQVECLLALRRFLQTDGNKIAQLAKDLQVRIASS